MSGGHSHTQRQSEADRYDREKWLPNDPTLYKKERARIYPDCSPTELPGSTEADKQRYKELQDFNTRRRGDYKAARKRAENSMQDRPQLERTYYETSSGKLLPRDHRELEPLAGAWGASAYNHGRAREDTNVAHPYMDTSIRSKKVHHAHIRAHYLESDEAYREQETHGRYAAARQSHERDLYGNQPTRGYKPYEDPYPPAFPPEGYYSKNASEIDPLGEGWSEPVRKSRRH